MINRVFLCCLTWGCLFAFSKANAQQLGDPCYQITDTKNCADLYGPRDGNAQCNDSVPYCDAQMRCNRLASAYYSSLQGYNKSRNQAEEVTTGGKSGANSVFFCITYHDCDDCEWSDTYNDNACVVGDLVYTDDIDDWTLGLACVQDPGGGGF